MLKITDDRSQCSQLFKTARTLGELPQNTDSFSNLLIYIKCLKSLKHYYSVLKHYYSVLNLPIIIQIGLLCTANNYYYYYYTLKFHISYTPTLWYQIPFQISHFIPPRPDLTRFEELFSKKWYLFCKKWYFLVKNGIFIVKNGNFLVKNGNFFSKKL